MNCHAEKLGFLRRNIRLRHIRQRLLEFIEFPLDKRMEIAYELLRLENSIHEAIAVGLAEYTDRRLQYRVYIHQL